MKNISSALKAHLAQEVTTLCTCWRAELTNGRIYGFTDHSRDIVFGGVIYSHASGFTPTATDTSSMLNVDNMEVEAILDNSLIKEEDLIAGIWDFAKVEVFWVNWNDLSMGKLTLKSGTLGQITMKRTSFVAEIRGLTQAYANTITEITSPMCRAKLGDGRCKVDLAALTTSGTVEAVSGDNRTLSDSSLTAPGPAVAVNIIGISRAAEAVVTTDVPHGFRNGQSIFISGVVGVVQNGSVDSSGVMQVGTGESINGFSFGIANVTDDTFTIPVDTRLGVDHPSTIDGPAYSDVYSDYVSGGTAAPAGQSGYYDYGMVTFTSGRNMGLSMEVKSYVPGFLELHLPMPFPMAVGDTYTRQPGCGKRLIDDCKNKFDNVINFRGEPYLPGFDKASTYATHIEGSTSGSSTLDGTGGSSTA